MSHVLFLPIIPLSNASSNPVGVDQAHRPYRLWDVAHVRYYQTVFSSINAPSPRLSFPVSSSGHIRSLCVLAAKIITARETVISFLVPNKSNTLDAVKHEVIRTLQENTTSLGTINVIAVGEHEPDPEGLLSFSDTTAFESVWKSIIAGQSVRCSQSGVLFHAQSPPTFVALDSFMYTWLLVIRQLSGKSIPVYAWIVSHAGALLQWSGQGKYGLEDVIRLALEAEDVEGGPKFVKVKSDCTGALLRIPGLPDMYDWELQIQHVPEDQLYVGMEMYKFIRDSSGLICASSTAWEAEGIKGLGDFLGERNQKCFALGPMLPFYPGTTQFVKEALHAEMSKAPNGMGENIIRFLDRHAEASVLYISWGTFWWPSNSHAIWILLDLLEKRQIPFVMSHASALAVVPDAIRAKYADSHLGILSPWAPQHNILSHESIGFFLTHCGYNSAAESLSQGVPLICWPIHADQPQIAAAVTLDLDAGFELLEVRTGEHATKTPRRFGTGDNGKCVLSGTPEAIREEMEALLEAMRGEEGRRKRGNARAVKERMAKAWAEGGSATLELERLFEHHVNR
ncbi:hypothetical protein EW146_g5139 [Bondarzewia mesenterica]|uniref:UDP-glycosyltransferases domain-containing protein n=1 Tax=Bondarzewia mesenterica TaxID=1095465 RepID=A0A4S4LSD1_9AGAM|nr:hypothetical protein EW146_g5139 [Bondarzewia mesenterica]